MKHMMRLVFAAMLFASLITPALADGGGPGIPIPPGGGGGHLIQK